jgi:uncharacterized membrane protein
MGLLILILIFAAAIAWLVLSSRIRELSQKLEREMQHREAADHAIALLTGRVSVLERSTPPAPVASAAPAPAVEKAVEKVVEKVVAPPKPVEATIPVSAAHPPAMPPPLPKPVPVSVPAEPPSLPSEPRPTLRDRVRATVGDEGWEAMVGGSWLNKLGVLLLVIGIALLLGYEFTRVGPVGRVAIGLSVSLTMLLGGVVVERRPVYAIFGRGLIGGGWASLYFTTYAMHALEAARVIDNAYLATALLLTVASGMILHSLRYRSQTVTGLAYFIAFATLALTESTTFSVLALIPLAASLLMLAYRFDWFKMAVFGLFATYATCASRPDTGAPLAATQALFAAYWLLFEFFDVLRLRRRVSGFSTESLILPMNAAGFIALSAVKWHRAAPDHLYLFLAACAGLYFASAVARVFASRGASGGSTLERIASGEYEGPITISAGLAALSIFRRAPGIWIDAGLLIEGEALFLAGWRFGQVYLRQLAAAVFTSLLVRLIGIDVPAGGATVVFAKHAFMKWSPAAIVTSAAFYLNRALRVAEGAAYSSVAAALIALVLAFECPQQYLCVAWLIFAAILFELGIRRRQGEFVLQSYAVGILGTAAGVLINVVSNGPDWRHAWVPVAVAAAIHYAITMRIRSAAPGQVAELVPWITSSSACLFIMTVAARLAPGEYLGLAWLIAGAALFELGMRKLPEQFRLLSYAVSGLGFLRLLYFDVILVHKGGSNAEAISLAVATLVCAAMSTRLFRIAPDRIAPQEREWARDVNCGAATLFVMTLAWLELPAALVALAWAFVSVVILELGHTLPVARFRWIGNAAAHAAFGRLFLANFTNFGTTAHISHRILTVTPIALSEYFIWSRYRDANVPAKEKNFSRVYLYTAAVLIFVMMRFELGRSMAVVGWALFCLVLFRSGVVSKIADLRWQSYAIALLAFWRCWSTNFYIPESLGGIRARILTGALVTASFYAAQLLAPRGWRARTFYSILASLLLAVLLFYEVSGGMLTMAWGVEALALLAAGFPLRDRVQRISGLFLFLVCVLKLFLYDLRQLETINRILSFIVLGVILVSVSWIYTRFRDRIQRYL